MTIATATTARHVRPSHRILVRSLGVVGAVLAALAAWTVAVPLLGTDLLIRFGSGAPQTIMVESVIGASLVGSLLGWGFLAFLERRTEHAQALWTALAIVALLLSLTLPLSAGATTSAKLALATMHLAVAAVLVPTLVFTSRRRDRRSAHVMDSATTGR